MNRCVHATLAGGGCKGILPVIDEDMGPPEAYGPDRLFVAYGEHDGLAALAAQGDAVMQLASGNLGAEFFRWEFATAVAGAILGINPFDQPNVEAARSATSEILASGPGSVSEADGVQELLSTLRQGDYVAVQAYVDPTPETEELLRSLRLTIRDRYGVATTVGIGPRFLHSTGQLHKGGPDTGVSVQVVDRSRTSDISIPRVSYRFGELIDAQALGDLRSLQRAGRRVSRASLDQIGDVA